MYNPTDFSFMEQVATGEALFAQGPSYYVPAAIAFFKAQGVPCTRRACYDLPESCAQGSV